MATIIDLTYFDREPLYLPQADSINVRLDDDDKDVAEISIENFIEICERNLLIEALGIDNYEDLQDALELLPFAEDTEPPSLGNADQKWIDLVNGKTYEINDKKYRWEGLKGFNKQSLLAFYVKASYHLARHQLTDVTGVIDPKAKGAENLTSTRKFISAWQSFMTMYQSTDRRYPDVYENAFGTIGVIYSQKSKIRSLYQFLTDSNQLVADTYPDLDFYFFSDDESYNSLGI